jgi:type I restriction enzyme S subunit
VTVRSASIGEVAVLNPKRPAHLDDNGALIPFIPMAAVRYDGAAPAEERRSLAELNSGYTYFERGDVLLAKITPCFENGKVAHLDSLPCDFGFGSTEFHVLRAGPDVDSRYLYHAVRGPQFRRVGASGMTGSAGQRRVPAAFVSRYRIPLPPLSEQRRIAAVLDKADAILRKRRESLQLLERFLSAAFLEVFGDPVTNEKGWKLSWLGEHLLFVTSGSRGWARYYSESGRPFLRIQNVGRNGLNLQDLAHVEPPLGAEAERTAVRSGDILLSITADLGRTAVVTPGLAGAHINQHLALLRVRDIEPLFVAQFLASEGGRRQFRNLNRQAVKAGLNFDDIRSLRIPIPPRERQNAFATLYRRWEATDKQFRHAAQIADLFSDSLAHRFLSSAPGT